jgi:hypothetical protein
MKILTAIICAAIALPLAAQLPTPTPEHMKLASQVGTWDAVMEYTEMDGAKAKTKGVSVRKQPLGAFWLIDTFKGNVMGQVFRGNGTTGYDPAKKKYVGTWIDSLSPSIMVIEGNYDKSGKVLTMSGMGPGLDGQPVMHRLVTTIKDANTHIFEMRVPDSDGKYRTTMTIRYTRRTQSLDRVR